MGVASSRLQPRLKHQHIPQGIRPIAPTGKVLSPAGADWRGVEKAFALEPILGQQILRPFLERSAQPVLDGHVSHPGRSYGRL